MPSNANGAQRAATARTGAVIKPRSRRRAVLREAKLTPANPLRELPGYLLRRVSGWAMAELAKRLEETELTPTEASVLVIIASNPGITQSEIGRMLGIASANMTPLVAAIDRRDLIKRLPLDKRSYSLRTTRRGVEVSEQVYAAMQAQEDSLLGAVPEKDRAGFLRALRQIAAEIDD